MSFRNIKQYSLKKRIIYSILLIILSQLIGCLIMINFVSNSEKFDKKIFNMLIEQIYSKSDNIKYIMYNISKNIDEKSKEFNNIIEDELLNYENIHTNEIYLYDDIFKILEKTAISSLINVIDKNDVTGAFIILNGSNKDKNSINSHSSIYLRSNKDFYSIDNKYEINMKMGNKDLANEAGIGTKDYWKRDYNFDISIGDEYKDIYTIPVDMAKVVGNKFIDSTFGYWSSIFRNFSDNISIITYTVPLIDSNNNIYGVYGIEISYEYITDMIESISNLNYKKSFIIAGDIEEDKLLYKKCFLKNGLAEEYLSNFNEISLHHIKGFKNIKKAYIPYRDKNEIFYIIYSDINLNKIKKAFDKESFKLILLVNKDDIILYSNIAKNLFIIPLIFSIIAAIFISTFLSISIVSKLKELSKYILNFKGDTPLTFYKTNLKEINELINAINRLSNVILDYDKRISKILDMTKMPIGCFEDRENTDMVFVTSRLLDILGIDKNLYDSSYIPKHDWDKIFFKILEGYVKGKRNIYRWKDNEDSIVVKWIRFESAMFDDKNIGIIMDVTEDMRKQAQLEFELDYDIMTHLLNRNAFKRKIIDIIACNPEKIGAVIFADLDNLKYINDTYGHDIGDKYIISAAEMFSYFKLIGGIVARISGDEFAMFIYGFDNLETAREKVYSVISKNSNCYINLPNKEKFKIKSSLGISWYGINSDDIVILMKYADFAMYECKSKNKGGVVEFNKEVYEKNICMDERRDLLCKMIEENLIKFVFQPIMAVNSYEVWGYEAFMKSKIDKFKNTVEILSIAEVYSKLYEIEKLTIFNLIEWSYNNRNILKNKKICINTIVTQILKDEDFEIISDKLSHINNNIVYELTNNDVVSEIQIMKKLNMLRNKSKGIIAIYDSVSSKISELEVLTIRPDIVKLDRKAIINISVDKDKQKLVGNLISHYKSNNIKTIAACVETKEELETLIFLGVDMVQGNYLCKATKNLIDKDVEKEMRRKILEVKGNKRDIF